MKNYIYLVWLLVFSTLLLSKYTFSQTEDPFIQDLYSNDLLRVSGAAFEIMDRKIIEAIPDLTELMESKPPKIQLLFLKALYVLEDSDIYEKTIEFINRADEFVNDEYPMDPLKAKAEATSILISLGDYSTHNYILELLNRDRPLPQDNVAAFQLLDDIAENLPQYEEQIKNEMIEIWDSNEEEYYRYYAMDYLVEKYGYEMIERTIDAFTYDQDLPIRFLALENLFKLNYQALNALLKERLTADQSHSMRLAIADSLLIKFGEPSDLKAVIDFQPYEPDETTRSLMGFSVQEFIPPNPAYLALDARILNLISYTDKLYEYEWITEEETYNYYQDRLYELREAIENGYDETACTIIYGDLLEKIDQDEQEDLITTEGYKFLHYHTIYIKEIFEEEIGGCQ